MHKGIFPSVQKNNMFRMTFSCHSQHMNKIQREAKRCANKPNACKG